MTTGEKSRERREEFGSTLDTIATLARVSTPALSKYERGISGVLSAAAIERVERTYSFLETIQSKSKGPLNMNNLAYLRKEFRKLGRKNPAPQIEQVWGKDFVERFSALARITPREFLSMSQLAPRLADAEIYSTIAQRWCAAWSSGIERAIKSADDTATFDDFQKAFPDRHAALTELARRVFDKLLGEVGKEKIQEYQAALLTTGELRQSPRDVSEN